MEESNKTIKRILIKYQGGIILIVGLILMFFLPMILTQCPSIIDFTNSGQIGDTIGGITAPISGFLGAFLVYIAFMEQVKANRIQNGRYEAEQRRMRLNGYVDNFKLDIDLNDSPKGLIDELHSSLRNIFKEIPNENLDEIESRLKKFYDDNEQIIHRLNYVFDNALSLYYMINDTDDESSYMPILKYYLSFYVDYYNFSNFQMNYTLFHKSMKQNYNNEIEQSSLVVFEIIYPVLEKLLQGVIKIDMIYCLNMKVSKAPIQY